MLSEARLEVLIVKNGKILKKKISNKLGKHQIGPQNAQFWGLKTWGQVGGGGGPAPHPWIC